MISSLIKNWHRDQDPAQGHAAHKCQHLDSNPALSDPQAIEMCFHYGGLAEGPFGCHLGRKEEGWGGLQASHGSPQAHPLPGRLSPSVSHTGHLHKTPLEELVPRIKNSTDLQLEDFCSTQCYLSPFRKPRASHCELWGFFIPSRH